MMVLFIELLFEKVPLSSFENSWNYDYDYHIMHTIDLVTALFIADAKDTQLLASFFQPSFCSSEVKKAFWEWFYSF